MPNINNCIVMLKSADPDFTFWIYSKICLNWTVKKRQTKVLKTNGSLMKVESVAVKNRQTKVLKTNGSLMKVESVAEYF